MSALSTQTIFHRASPLPNFRPSLIPDFMTLQEASMRCSLSIDTLRRRARNGELRLYQSGKSRNSRLLVRSDDLDAMLRPIPMIETVA